MSYDLKYDYIHNMKLFKYSCSLFSKLNTILYFVALNSPTIHLYNNSNFKNYLPNCPFLSSDLFSNNTSYYGNRICELYNIYSNSRYKYQYICSYSATEDLEGYKSDNGFDLVICTPKISNISHNNIIKQFSSIYENTTQLFYCSRFDLPKKNELIKDEYCHNKINFPYFKN